MTLYGHIYSYDSARGMGTIAPESGGDVLPFRRADMVRPAVEPVVDQRFGYQISFADNGRKRAINLEPQGEAHSNRQAAIRQHG